MTSWIAALGAASAAAFWTPVLAWTALALACEAALRLGRAPARLGLGVRGALVALLPALVVVVPALALWVPSIRPSASFSVTETDVVDLAAASLPLASAGGEPAAVSQAMSAVDVALGLATLAAAVASVLAVGVLIGGLVWLGRYRRGLGTAPPAVQSQAEALARQLGLGRRPRVVQAEPASAPFTVGWRRPVVAVPPDLAGEPLRLALAHEIAHAREAHYGWALAERAVRALFVWHPLAHALGRSLALDRERLADAVVVRLWPECAQSYGRLLASVSARPAPGLALGASSSTLIIRLDAMTRFRPDRPRWARLTAALVLTVPLLVAAAAAPDPVPPLSPTSATASPAVAADTLDRYIAGRRLRVQNGEIQLDITLQPTASRDVAEAVADQYAQDGEPGVLRVRYNGGVVTRSTVRRDRMPAPPDAPEPPSAPEPPPAAPDAPPPAPPSPPATPASPAVPSRPAPPSPPTPPAPPVAPDHAEDYERVVAVLEAELLDVEQEIVDLRDKALGTNGGRPIWESVGDETRYIRLDTRRDLIRSRYRAAVQALESHRLDSILRSTNGDG